MKIIARGINRTENYRLYDDYVIDVDDLYLGDDPSIGEIYREMQREYGRCVSKMYKDLANNEQGHAYVQIGWVFEKRVKYDDSKETFLQETWVSLADRHEHVLEHKDHYLGRVMV